MSQLRKFLKKIPYVLSLYILALRIYNPVISHVKIMLYNPLVAIGADFKTQAKFSFINRPRVIIMFDPNLVNYGLNRNVDWIKPKTFLSGGNWDQRGLFKIDESSTAETIHQLFIDELPYKETTQYKEMLWAIESGHPEPKKIGAYWCKSIEDIDEYFTILLKAYEAIKTEGYKTQTELAEIDPKAVCDSKNEIQLYIDRYGNLLLGHNGTHRLLIAKLLSLPLVPGLIMGLHEEWARFCHDYYGNRSLETNIKEAINERWKLY